MASSLVVAASALLSLVAAAPVVDRSSSGLLEARQAPNCNIGTQVGNAAAYDISCWNTLNIMSYLTNWKATTPTCTDAETTAGQTLKCCGASEPWSTCFLRLATVQLNAYDCTQLAPMSGGPSCSFEGSGGRAFALDPNLDPTIASQVNYVVLNIIMINNFFASYNIALQNAVAKEGSNLNSALTSSASANLNRNVDVDLQNVITALTLGLAFPEIVTPNLSNIKPTVSNGDTTASTFSIKRDPQNSNTNTSSSPAPSSSSTFNIKSCDTYGWTISYFQNGHHRRRDCEQQADPTASLNTSSAPVVIFNRALQQSPNVASAMWPSALNSATDTVSNLVSNHLSDSASYAPVLTAGLQLIMGDVGTFIAFAGNGIFSTPFASTDSPAHYSSGFTGALNTYLLSEIMAHNSISATPGGISPSNPCSTGPLCTYSYWSPVTGRQYTFTGSDTLSLINEWSDVDLPTLFDGAYNCTFAGQAGGSVVSLAADNTLNMACLSALPMYVRDTCPDGAVYVDGKCPFGFA